MNTLSKFGSVAIVALGLSANAAPITISSGNPGNQGTDNVLFNDDSLQHSGLLVEGNFNGIGSGFVINFTSASGNGMIEGGGGQATITGLEGNNPFTSLTFYLTDATFTKAILNPNATVDGTIDFSVSFIDAAGSPFEATFALDGQGNNFFGIEAAEGAKITSVTFSSTDTEFVNASQFRIGGFERTTPGGNVPDGGMTMMLLGAALSTCAGARRYFRK